VDNLRLEIRPAVRGKVDLIVRDENGGVVLTDLTDLSGIKARREAAQVLCARLREKGVERSPADIENALEARWAEYVQERERQEAEDAAARAAASGGEEDPDAREQRRLNETPADLRAEAEALLRDPRLMLHVANAVEAMGVAGEQPLGVTLYLVGTSRKLRRPLAAMVKGPTASGKSFVIERAARLMPPESVLVATQITPQALFHMTPGVLRHCFVIAGERARRDDDDTAEATRALREMISAGRLSKLMPVKFGHDLQTVLIEQEGPIAYVESTTLTAVFEEDENRCISVCTDERPTQTRRVLTRAASDYAGVATAGNAGRVAQVHHTAQRLLARREVVVPYAPRLAELLPEERVEARRAFPQLVSLIQASALLHQYQRPSDGEGRVVAVREDYHLARWLLADPMRRLLGGGVSEASRRFFCRLRGWFGEAAFTTTEARLKERTSRAAVHGWLGELARAGALEQVEPGRGPRPARWHTTQDELDAEANVLPDEEAVCQG
jgi:hypothetical protein